MNSRKPRRNNNHNHNHNHNHPGNNTYPNHNQVTDYESDAAYFSDMQQQHQPPAPPSRTNEEISLSVLRRHNPDITSILSLAQYAVVYIFSPTTRQWEKNGVEGTLFVCQLTQGSLGEERYTAFVLNRRGLNNFDLQLTDGDNVELTEEYVILKADETDTNGVTDPSNPQASQSNGTGAPGLRIYGIWIYSEPPPNSTAQARTINAEKIRECAAHAGQSLKMAREHQEAIRQNGLHAAAAAAETHVAPLQEVQASVPMGRQISLKDLFGQQRAQDDGWSVRAHHVGPVEHQQQQQEQVQQERYQQPPPPQQQYQQPPQQQYQQPLPQQYPPQYPPQHYQQPQGYPMMPQHHQQPPPPPQPQSDVLGDLFRRAGFAYQGNGQGQ
jgi:hypothetical protein